MNDTIVAIIGMAIGFVLGYVIKKIKYPIFQISIDEKGKPVITQKAGPVTSTGKAEFIAEPTQEDIEELNKEPKLKKFLKKFKKPKKE